MTNWTKEELEEILEKDFLVNPAAFAPGHTNDDMVDSMCICHALDREWTEMFAKWVDANTVEGNGVEWIDHGHCGAWRKERETKRIMEHYERVKDWLDAKELVGYGRGDLDIMGYAINY